MSTLLQELQVDTFSRPQLPVIFDRRAPSGITGLTGGGVTNFDGIDVADYAVGTRMATVISGVLYNYTLTTSAAAESSPTVIAPDTGNSAVRWLLDVISPSSVGLTATQIGFGSAGNVLTGEAAFTYTAASNLLTVDSIAANATTDLTLSAGSSGASLVLGQGANGSVTITPAGTGRTFLATHLSVGTVATLTMPATTRALFASPSQAVSQPTISLIGSAGGYGAGVDFVSALSDAATTYVSMAKIVADGSAAWDSTAANQDAALSFWTTNNGTITKQATLTNLGNLLIGGTTDITGSGGLKVFGTTVSTSTTSGALQVAGGVGVAGALFAGGNLTVTKTNPSLDLNNTGGGGSTWSTYVASATGKYTVDEAGVANWFNIAKTTGLATFVGDLIVSGGNVGVGTAASSDRGVGVSVNTLTGTTQFGIVSNSTFSSGATTQGTALYAATVTAAAAYTMVNGCGVYVDTPGLGAASAITTQTGISVQNQGASGVANAYGIDIAAQSGAATTNVGLRNAGSTLLATGITLCNTTATPAAGSTSARILFGTTAGFGIYYGSGAPTVSAAQGSFYMRSDGSSTSTRAYVNTDGGTTWTALTTAA